MAAVARAPRRPVQDVSSVKTVEEGCALLQQHVDDGSLSTEFYAQFPNVLTAIFGVEGRRAWVDSLLPRKDLDALYKLLNAQGPIMNLVMNYKDEDSIRFEVPIKHVPSWMRKVVAAQIRAFYGYAPFTTGHVFVLSDPNGAPNPVLILNILEYFLSAVAGYCQNTRPPVASDSSSAPSGAISSSSSSSSAAAGRSAAGGSSALSPRLHLYHSTSSQPRAPSGPAVRPYLVVLSSYLRAAFLEGEAPAGRAKAPGALARVLAAIAVEHWMLQNPPPPAQAAAAAAAARASAAAAAAAGQTSPSTPAPPAAPAIDQEPYLQPTPELLDATQLLVWHLHAGVTLPALASPAGPAAGLAAELADIVKVPLHGFLSQAMSRSSSQTVFLRAADVWCAYLEPWAAPDALADWMARNLDSAHRGPAYPPRKTLLDSPAAVLQAFCVANFAFYAPILELFVEKVAAVDFAVLGLASLGTNPMYQKLLQVLHVFAPDAGGGVVRTLDALAGPDSVPPLDSAARRTRDRIVAELAAAGVRDYRPRLQGSGRGFEAARRLLQNLRALRSQELATAHAAAEEAAAAARPAPVSPAAAAPPSPVHGPAPASPHTPAFIGGLGHSLSASLRSLARPSAGPGSPAGPAPSHSVDSTCRALEALFHVPHEAGGPESGTARPSASPLFADSERGTGRLTREGVDQLRRGKRLCSNLDVPVLTDPALVPVASTEVAGLVRLLVRASARVNAALALGPHAAAESPGEGPLPRLARAIATPDRRKRMRANLRPLADVRNQAALALAVALFAIVLHAIVAR